MTTHDSSDRLAAAVPLPIHKAEPQRQPDAAEVLRQLQESALGLLAGLGRAPSSLRIKADQVEIELQWPEPAASPGTAGAAPADATPTDVPVDTGHHVLAQTVGVFYRCPEPGAKPFVEPGDVVARGQQLGIIEAMKLMIPVEAEAAGRITEALVADGSPVEYGDRLFAFEPVGG
jgi:acetyl-CoA carboxylase biotin carboxyl carrier protein